MIGDDDASGEADLDRARDLVEKNIDVLNELKIKIESVKLMSDVDPEHESLFDNVITGLEDEIDKFENIQEQIEVLDGSMSLVDAIGENSTGGLSDSNELMNVLRDLETEYEKWSGFKSSLEAILSGESTDIESDLNEFSKVLKADSDSLSTNTSMKCFDCGEDFSDKGLDKLDFCPNCGSSM